MPYLLLVVESPGDRERRGPVEGKRARDRMLRFADELRARGVLQACESLRTESVRVNVREGWRRVVDGPFAEAKELVGGFFLLDCATRDEAIEIASACPAVEWATVEVREIGPCWEGTD
jgi:hypothetical protein